jgi:hypothetical protein
MSLDAMKELERKPYSSESMRVRCPHCRKLYLVQFTDIKESKPKFECVQCRSRFWLSLPDMDLTGEVTGLPIHVKEAPRSKSVVEPSPNAAKEPCPKCFKPNVAGATECTHCGVIIAKAKEALGFIEGVARSETLALLWKKVVGDYANAEVHDEFIRACEKESNLIYASAQYGQMLKLMPSDDVTRQRVTQVLALGSVPLAHRVTGDFKSRVKAHYSKLWQVPLFGAALMIIVGLAIPIFRNLIGVGAAFLFLAAAFQIQFRRR